MLCAICFAEVSICQAAAIDDRPRSSGCTVRSSSVSLHALFSCSLPVSQDVNSRISPIREESKAAVNYLSTSFTAAYPISCRDVDGNLVDCALQPGQDLLVYDRHLGRTLHALILHCMRHRLSLKRTLEREEIVCGDGRGDIPGMRVLLQAVRRHHRQQDGIGCPALEDDRSEERRVGKECRSRWSPYH